MNIATVRLLFVVAGLYDFIIGLVFLLFGRQLFDATGVPRVQAEKALSQWRENDKLAALRERSRRVRDPFRRS